MSEDWDFHLLPGEVPELDGEFIAKCNMEKETLLADIDTPVVSHE